MLKIGSYKMPTNILLAPMAGCTDLAFRRIAREEGAKFAFFEMVDCNSITYGPKGKVLSLLRTIPEDRPIAAQILGAEASRMLAGAREIIRICRPSFIDINAACPVKKVIKKRAGAYLIEDTDELNKILKKLASSLPVPVTVKIRIGYLEPDVKKIVKLAALCENSGAAAIFVHGRTRAQGYSGQVNYNIIRAIKESVAIPVIGSGDIFSPALAGRMLQETGSDGILVARGALGNPWIFGQIEKYMADNIDPDPVGLKTIKNVLKRHLSYIEEYRDIPASGKLGRMRKAALWYLKAFPDAAAARKHISLVNGYGKMIKLIDGL